MDDKKYYKQFYVIDKNKYNPEKHSIPKVTQVEIENLSYQTLPTKQQQQQKLLAQMGSLVNSIKQEK